MVLLAVRGTHHDTPQLSLLCLLSSSDDTCFLLSGGRAVSTPDYPEPLRSSLTDAEAQRLQRDMWPRKNVPNPTQVPHRTSALPEPLQNSMADAEYVEVRRRQ